MFRTLVNFASEPRHRPHHYIGGNAALMAQKIATFPKTTVSYALTFTKSTKGPYKMKTVYFFCLKIS